MSEGSVVAIASFGVEPTDKERLLIEALGNVLVKAGMLLPSPMSGPEVLAHAGIFCDDTVVTRSAEARFVSEEDDHSDDVPCD